jgi:hypothetical protein
MKKLIACFLLYTTHIAYGQVVCNLAYERTLQTFSVYIHNPSGATMYKAKLYIDADGSPRAYGPGNSGLDYTANAGSTGNWYGVVSDASGQNPIIQTASDPFPGMYVSTTSLVNSHYAIANPLRYVNSETVPYIAMPTNVLASGNVHVGDVAYVYNTLTGQSCFAIYADAGNTTSIGEGSIYLAGHVGVNPNVRTGGTSAGIIDYVVFPQSGFGQGYIPTIAQIDSMGNVHLNAANVGGSCIVACLGSTVDNILPTTAVSVPAAWDTTAFTATFTDADAGCLGGVSKSYYRVDDYNTTNEWRANNTHGFFFDQFTGPSINPAWTARAGTWNNGTNELQQSDETSANTNLYAPLTQSLSDSYVYHWKGSIGGTGTNRRAGFHFFADQPDSSNRGNSYFVYFRVDDDKVQIYEVVNNSWGANPVKDTAHTFAPNTVYDFKIMYNRITGLIRVFVNDVQSAEWVDSTPLSNGSYVSFRSADCTYKVDDFEVFRSRTASTVISVGAGNTGDIRYPNQNPSTAAGRISSLVMDIHANLGTIVTQTVNVDFTAPLVSLVKDGTANDIDTTYNATQLEANWPAATDANSGIAAYEYAIGTTAGASNIKGWTSIANSTSVTATGLSLVHLQTYFVSMRAQNGAGMRSAIVSSNGQVYADRTTGIVSKSIVPAPELLLFPNPTTGQCRLSCKQFTGETSVTVTDVLGKGVLKKIMTDSETSLDLSEEQNGIYYIILTNAGKLYRTKVLLSKIN